MGMFFIVGFLCFVTQTSAYNTYNYFAEHNFICNVCKKSVNYIINGKSSEDVLALCDDNTNTQFTTLCDDVNKYTPDILSMNEENATIICESLSMCNKWNDNEFKSTPAWNIDSVDDINNNNSIQWTAELPETFKDMTLSQVRMKLGSIIDTNYVYKLPIKSERNIQVPKEFDSRIQWPYCANTIGHIRDQSECGSCWAFAPTEAMNDRLCIANVSSSNNIFTQLLSVEDTTSCCTDVACGYSAGCDGGMPTAVWKWFESDGVCSGGDYPDIGKNDSCLPYELPPCAHAGQPSKDYTPCPTTQYNTPKCEDKCSNKNYGKAFNNDKHFGKSAYSLRSVQSMMEDIVQYGSIAATMLVHQDFLSYKSGVYYWQNGQPLGGHAVKIFGYGIENGQKYWWCTNSWNDEWGDNGFFKILKGTDESGIEDNVSGGLAKS